MRTVPAPTWTRCSGAWVPTAWTSPSCRVCTATIRRLPRSVVTGDASRNDELFDGANAPSDEQFYRYGLCHEAVHLTIAGLRDVRRVRCGSCVADMWGIGWRPVSNMDQYGIDQALLLSWEAPGDDYNPMNLPAVASWLGLRRAQTAHDVRQGTVSRRRGSAW